MESVLEIKTIENAPEASNNVLTQAKNAYGFSPNLLGVMANHPALLNSYWSSNKELAQHGVLSPTEQQVVYLTVSYENNCHYCMAAHTTLSQMSKVPQDVLDAVRNGEAIADSKLEALRQYTKATTINRGRVSQDDIDAFNNAGYGQDHQLEVVLITGIKVLSNYINYLGQTPLDAPFTANAWEKK